MLLWTVAASALIWISVLLLPWRPWSTREHLVLADKLTPHLNFDDITVLVPARNEAACITQTLASLSAQGRFAAIIVINDQSEDRTADLARQTAVDELMVVDGTAPGGDWSGKLWALEQGRQYADSEYTLLLDADIGLNPGVVAALRQKLRNDQLDMASVMANLHMVQFWEKLLLPPFVYFFKLIYPFALAASPRSSVAAGAGGCVLLRTRKLNEIGGFAVLKGAIIDDCTLAKKIKNAGGRIWIGLSNDARALRPYENLTNIWNMVARTAYTQLHYSKTLLLGCTLLLILAYVVPIATLFLGTGLVRGLAGIAVVGMLVSYRPIVRFYQLPTYWTLSLPLAAVLFLAMTWTSAVRYARGERSRWKNRSYSRAPGGA